MNRPGAILLTLLLAGWLAACGGEAALERPPEILYGEDICEECGMLISDPRFAAAYVTADQEIRLFDDVGGMFAHDRRRQEAVAAYWVHDFPSQEWIRAERAAYVVEGGQMTPMGWGVVAFADLEPARAYAEANGGRVKSFEDMRAAALAPDHAHGSGMQAP